MSILLAGVLTMTLGDEEKKLSIYSRFLFFVWHNVIKGDKRTPVIYCCRSFDPYSPTGFPVKLCSTETSAFTSDWLTLTERKTWGKNRKNSSYIYRLTDVFSVKTKSGHMFDIVSTATGFIWTRGFCGSLKEASLWIPNVWAHSSVHRLGSLEVSTTSFGKQHETFKL